MAQQLAKEYVEGLVGVIVQNIADGHIFGVNDDNGEELTAYDWLENVLDIQYVVTSKREYLGARLLLTYGGPNTWLDTRTGKVKTFWGDTAERYVPETFTDALDEALEELWETGA